jgi:hypothetical protein
MVDIHVVYRWRCTGGGGYIFSDRSGQDSGAYMVDIHVIVQVEMYGGRGTHYLG